MKGYDRPLTIPGWEAITKAWLKLLDDYALAQDGDVAHWYGERATLSTLAGAAWRSKGVCLQEYACEKGTLSGRDFGRGDLWFRVGAEAYTVEAKQFWPASDDDIRDNLGRLLAEACNDVGRHHRREGPSHRIGVVFVTPKITLAERLASDAAIQSLIDATALPAQRGWQGRAWWFPKGKRKQESPWKGREGYYPGVIMVSRCCGFVAGS